MSDLFYLHEITIYNIAAKLGERPLIAWIIELFKAAYFLKQAYEIFIIAPEFTKIFSYKCLNTILLFAEGNRNKILIITMCWVLPTGQEHAKSVHALTPSQRSADHTQSAGEGMEFHPASSFSLCYAVKALCCVCWMSSPLHHSYQVRSPAAHLEKSWGEALRLQGKREAQPSQVPAEPSLLPTTSKTSRITTSWAQLRSQNLGIVLN